MGVVVGEAEKHTPTCLSKLENDQTLTATSLAVLVATDRQSDFDRALATVHHVLVQTSVWWFNQTKNIVANHLLGLTLSCYKSPLFLVEFTVPVYITGPTITSMLINDKDGSRDFFGHNLQDGYIQQQKRFWAIVVAKLLRIHTSSLSEAQRENRSNNSRQRLHQAPIRGLLSVATSCIPLDAGRGMK
ncbi:hypothetical protein V7S43_013202 [Phytophthora oleae]|uniref:phosphoribosylaminoimidazolesuccinocarboxamide synthase n=1 Tax=Phytophthora oleae TaxID=2107226 RepID=A0ABD3FA54_9STRA